MSVTYKRVLINIPEELLQKIDQAAKLEHRQRNEFVREALRDRLSRTAFKTSLGQVRAQAQNNYSEEEVDQDITAALAEIREVPAAGNAA